MAKHVIHCAGGCGKEIGTVELPFGRAYPGDERYGMVCGLPNDAEGCSPIYQVTRDIKRLQECVRRGICKPQDVPVDMRAE